MSCGRRGSSAKRGIRRIRRLALTVTFGRAAGGSSGKKRIRLTSDPPVNSCRPSVDVLFCSLAKACSGRVLAVIMTGMGSDGMNGVLALKQRNCYCIVQSEETCVVYGMPRAVAEAGLSDEKVPLQNMACRIIELVRDQPEEGTERRPSQRTGIRTAPGPDLRAFRNLTLM